MKKLIISCLFLVIFGLLNVTAEEQKPEILEGIVRIANPHPADGKEIEPETVYLETNGLPEPNQLQNSTHRGNQTRTGLWQTKGLKKQPKLKWKFKTGGPVKSSPVMMNGLVFVGSQDKNVYAIDAQTGEAKWQYKTRGPVDCSPTIADGVVYIGSGDKMLHAIKADSGEKVWQSMRGQQPIDATPALGYNAVFVLINGWGTGMMALEQKTGKPITRYHKCRGGGFRHSVILKDGIIIQVSPSKKLPKHNAIKKTGIRILLIFIFLFPLILYRTVIIYRI